MAHFLHIKDMYLATYLQLQLIYQHATHLSTCDSFINMRLIYQHATHLYLNRILSIIS